MYKYTRRFTWLHLIISLEQLSTLLDASPLSYLDIVSVYMFLASSMDGFFSVLVVFDTILAVLIFTFVSILTFTLVLVNNNCRLFSSSSCTRYTRWRKLKQAEIVWSAIFVHRTLPSSAVIQKSKALLWLRAQPTWSLIFK